MPPRRAPKPLLVSVDPGKCATYAVWDKAVLVDCGRVVPGIFDGLDADLVIEDQIIAKGFTESPKSIIATAHSAGEVAACFGGSYAVEWVEPSPWKRGSPKPDTAKLWMTYVIHRKVEKILTAGELLIYRKNLESFSDGERHNLADGVGIGLWKLRRLQW